MKKILMAVALIAHASPTLARSWVTASSCNSSRFYGYINCHRSSTYIPSQVRDVQQERRDAIERDTEDAKWEKFCRPTYKTDAYGIRRASYAQIGCEFGRNE